MHWYQGFVAYFAVLFMQTKHVKLEVLKAKTVCSVYWWNDDNCSVYVYLEDLWFTQAWGKQNFCIPLFYCALKAKSNYILGEHPNPCESLICYLNQSLSTRLMTCCLFIQSSYSALVRNWLSPEPSSYCKHHSEPFKCWVPSKSGHSYTHYNLPH